MHNPSLDRSSDAGSSQSLNRKLNRSARRGLTLIWGAVTLTALMGVASLGVDYGRVQLTKAELRRAADAAARVGAAAIDVSAAQAKSDAIAWSKRNPCDGRLLKDESINVTVGYWDTTTRTFKTTLSGSQTYNAVRVVLTRPAVGPESVPLIWGNVVGVKGAKISAECIAMYVPGININHQVDGFTNPFLANAPKGTVASPINPHHNPDGAGDATSSDPAKRKQSPPMIPLPVKEGDIIQFDGAAVGTVRHDPNLPFFNPDGELADIGHNNNTTGDAGSKSAAMYNENGIADTWAPINALVGVFTGDDNPKNTATPANLDFRTPESRDFSQLSPLNKQIFFIGDGVNGAGMRQSFVVPKGATKLFLATWDFYEWNNNAGYRMVKIQRPGRIVTVK